MQRIFNYDPDTGEFTKYTGTRGKLQKGYLYIKVTNVNKSGSSLYAVHRLIYKYMTGLEPGNLIHIDKDKLNNKWENLKNLPIVKLEEGVNLFILPKPTKYNIGSHRLGDRNRWKAIVKVNNRLTTLGIYKCPTAAQIAITKYKGK